MYHLLLICFLAGTAEEFFVGSGDKAPSYLPFGSPPYPCRNFACESHLQNVIGSIEVTKSKSMPRATFTCPHCGFAYRRKGKMPKEKQYAGQVHVVDYGWKWEKIVAAELAKGVSSYKIARIVHCDARTVLDYGVERGMLPPERRIERKQHNKPALPHVKPNFDAQRTEYRQRWLDAIDANPEVTRKELRLLDSKADQWLHLQ